MSFGGHQSQTTEHIKALYDMYKCILIISSIAVSRQFLPL